LKASGEGWLSVQSAPTAKSILWNASTFKGRNRIETEPESVEVEFSLISPSHGGFSPGAELELHLLPRQGNLAEYALVPKLVAVNQIVAFYAFSCF
jgi:hypothetical protein